MIRFCSELKGPFQFFCLSLVILSSSGCAVFGGSAKSDKEARIQELESQLREKNEALDELRERQLLARSSREEKLEGARADSYPRNQEVTPVPFSPSASLEHNGEPTADVIAESLGDLSLTDIKNSGSTGVTSSLKSSTNLLEPSLVSDSGEHYLYSKVIESFRKRNRVDIDKSVQLLLKSYPVSVYADNALWLQAKFAYLRGEPVKALGHLDRLLQQYPGTNKVPSALVMKVKVLQQLSRSQQANVALRQLHEFYPGFPELAELKIKKEIGDSP